jgi:hypothetical protein
VTILKYEVLDQQITPRGESAAAFGTVIQRLLQDVQERLAYRAQLYIRDFVQGFVPSPEDLDYPAKLKSATTTTVIDPVSGETKHEIDLSQASPASAARNITAAVNVVAATTTLPGTTSTALSTPTSSSIARNERTMFATWFPTLERTLLCLSKLYRCLEVQPCSLLSSIVQLLLTYEHV